MHRLFVAIHPPEDIRDRLIDADAEVTYRESPMPHTIDPAFLRELSGWVSQTVASAAAEDSAQSVE